MKIMITTDSSCDLPEQTVKERNIKKIAINVCLGDKEYLDGINITPQDIFDYVKQYKKLPKTSALSEEQFAKFFKECLRECDEVIHIGLSSKLSTQYTQSLHAAASFNGKVHVIDGKNLSTGTGLLVLAASDLANQGKTSKEIVETISARVPFVQASFIIQDTEYLYRGGRCSGIAMIGANLLKIKPRIQVVDGAMIPYGKPRGKMVAVLKEYVDNVLNEFNTPDTTRAFVTHSSIEPEIAKEICEYVKSKNIFKEVIETVAGATITSHCGKGTLGLLYINDGNKQD